MSKFIVVNMCSPGESGGSRLILNTDRIRCIEELGTLDGVGKCCHICVGGEGTESPLCIDVVGALEDFEDHLKPKYVGDFSIVDMPVRELERLN